MLEGEVLSIIAEGMDKQRGALNITAEVIAAVRESNISNQTYISNLIAYLPHAHSHEYEYIRNTISKGLGLDTI